MLLVSWTVLQMAAMWAILCANYVHSVVLPNEELMEDVSLFSKADDECRRLKLAIDAAILKTRKSHNAMCVKKDELFKPNRNAENAGCILAPLIKTFLENLLHEQILKVRLLLTQTEKLQAGKQENLKTGEEIAIAEVITDLNANIVKINDCYISTANVDAETCNQQTTFSLSRYFLPPKDEILAALSAALTKWAESDKLYGDLYGRFEKM